MILKGCGFFFAKSPTFLKVSTFRHTALIPPMVNRGRLWCHRRKI
jgi:hypothetical protein